MQLPPLPPAPELLPTTPRAQAQPPDASVGCACAATPGGTAVPPWRMPKISEEQPLAPSALRRHVAPVVHRKMQAEEAQQQEQAEQAQEVLPVFPDWGPGGDTTGMSEITCDNTEPPTDGEETLPKRTKTEQAENGPRVPTPGLAKPELAEPSVPTPQPAAPCVPTPGPAKPELAEPSAPTPQPSSTKSTERSRCTC